MLEPFIGEISWVAFDFAPEGWLVCDGRELPINQYQALFSLLGNRFGGNGTTTFKIPNLVGRVAVGTGIMPDTGTYQLGASGGSRQTVINPNQLPAHTHPATFTPIGTPANVTVSGTLQALSGVPAASLKNTPQAGQQLANTADPQAGAKPAIYAPAGSGTGVNLGGLAVSGQVTGGITGGTVAVGATGANAPLDNMQPYLALTPIIAVQGVYPPRP